MNHSKVLLCGKHDALLQAMRQSSIQTIDIEQYANPAPARQNIAMVVVLHTPPLTDGLPQVRHWQRESPDTPVVVATSDYTGATIRLLFKSGATDVLELPADQERIQACYEAYLPQYKTTNSW